MATTMMTTLEALRDALADISGVETCKIGLEENITPDDYPIIRIVPSRIGYGTAISRDRCDLLIYFGAPTQPFDDAADGDGFTHLEKVYAALFAMEAAIRTTVDTFGGLYVETITDEDRLETYKLMAVRCEVEG